MNPFAIAVQGIGFGALLIAAQGLYPLQVTEVAIEQGGGYFEPNIRRKTKREAYQEREKLRISIQDVEKAAQKVVNKSVANPDFIKAVDTRAVEYYYRPDVADLTKLLMAELRVTVALPDYRRAIEIAIAVRQEEEDLEAILLLM